MTTKTHVTFVLDSSGSMAAIEDDTRGGFNVFLEEQREEEGEATVTLYNFDTNVECVYRMASIEAADTLGTDNYRPGGQTALHDALATAIDETADGIEGLAEPDRPENVIVVVLTDGKENASETPQQRVREKVTYRQTEDDWEFLFIGANQDAALTAESMGMAAEKSLDMHHSGDGVKAAQASTSKSISRARREGSTGGYDESARAQQRDPENR